ncbi:hypothetical protein MHYP_G00226680 [Metynnis hypsauchen]
MTHIKSRRRKFHTGSTAQKAPLVLVRIFETEETLPSSVSLKADIPTRPDHMVLRHLDRTLIKHLHCGKRVDTVACVLCADLMV